jgi:hemerythrin-like domain-containing protein
LLTTAYLLALLADDHRHVRGLLEQILEEIDDDPEGARLLVDQARIHILAHAHAEARTLYVALEPHEITTDLAHEGREEHAVVESLLDELSGARVVDDAYRAKVAVIADMLDHHIEDEETQMFPRAARVLGRDRLDQLADELIAEKSRELFRLGDDEAADRLLGDNHQVVLGID